MKRPQLLLLAFPAFANAPQTQAPPVRLPIAAPAIPIEGLLRLAALDNGVDQDFVVGIAWRESNYNPTKVGTNTNGTRDFGVMQVNETMLGALGIRDWRDPVQNIRGGVRWLGELLRRYGSEAIADCVYGSGRPQACGAL